MDWNNPDDRKRERAARVAEIEAIDSGAWPRDISDKMRWKKQDAEHARRMCEATIALIDDKDGDERPPMGPRVRRRKIRVTDTPRFIALAADSEGRNRGPVPEFLPLLDPEKRHIATFEMDHNTRELRVMWLCGLRDGSVTMMMMDNGYRALERFTSFEILTAQDQRALAATTD